MLMKRSNDNEEYVAYDLLRAINVIHWTKNCDTDILKCATFDSNYIYKKKLAIKYKYFLSEGWAN